MHYLLKIPIKKSLFHNIVHITALYCEIIRKKEEILQNSAHYSTILYNLIE
jgi:hypothetical protein